MLVPTGKHVYLSSAIKRSPISSIYNIIIEILAVASVVHPRKPQPVYYY